jgi:hypothetical protein
MDRLSPAELAAQALDAAHAIEDRDDRDEAVAAAAAAAATAGLTGAASDALLDIDDPAARTWVHGVLSRQMADAGQHDGARRHLDAGIADCARISRWRPQGPGWMSLADAMARQTEVAAILGDTEMVNRLAGQVGGGGGARAAAQRARFDLACREGAVGARGEVWNAAIDAARAIPDPVDARRALVALARLAAQHGDGARAVHLVRIAADESPLGGAIHRAELAEAVAGVLAREDLLPEAATVWGRAMDLAQADDVPIDASTSLLCGIAEAQLAALGPMVAEHTVARAVAAVASSPLSPDPTLRFPWRRLCRTALQAPALASPLRDHLRNQTFVPPGWCYVLGLLELSTGNPRRAKGAAKALEASHAAWPEDTESLWLAALLRCRLGTRDEARQDLRTLLAAVEPGTTTELPGQDGGPVPLEQHLVRALLDMGDRDTAVELASTVGSGATRARLLREAGTLARLEGDHPAASHLARESLAARDEAHASGEPIAALDPELVALVCLLHDVGDSPTAMAALRRALESGRTTPDLLAVPVLAGLERQLVNALPLLDLVREAMRRRIEAAPSSKVRAALVLTWLRATTRT